MSVPKPLSLPANYLESRSRYFGDLDFSSRKWQWGQEGLVHPTPALLRSVQEAQAQGCSNAGDGLNVGFGVRPTWASDSSYPSLFPSDLH